MSGQVIEFVPPIRCDFCGAAKDDTECLFKGAGNIHICDRCIEQMGYILMMRRVEGSKR